MAVADYEADSKETLVSSLVEYRSKRFTFEIKIHLMCLNEMINDQK